MKNVTGLDLVKLNCGAHGTLGLVTEATFKLLPKPQSEATIVMRRLDDEAGVAALTRALGSPYGVSGAAMIGPGMGREFSRTLLRLEGFRRVGRLSRRAARRAARRSRRRARAARRRFATPVARRARRRIPRRAARQARSGASASRRRRGRSSSRASARWRSSHFYDWGGGLVWLASEPSEAAAAAVRAALAPLGGHATLIRAPDDLARPRRRVRAAVAGARAADARREGELRPGRRIQLRPDDCGDVTGDANPFHRGAARRPAFAAAGKNPALLRALRLLHRDLPDLSRSPATSARARAGASISSRTCWRAAAGRRPRTSRRSTIACRASPA